jgi:acyl-CoA thioesterase I
MRTRVIPIIVAGCVALSESGIARSEDPQLPGSDRAAVVRMLPELHLLEPIWLGTTAHRESFLPLQSAEGGRAAGRLAFPVKELLTVKSADGQRSYVAGSDFTLSDDRRQLLFTDEAKIAFVKPTELYPPAGAPNSYKHRTGHPEQNLLYSEGHWFHDRQIEVTYHHDPVEWPREVPAVAEKQLPETIARLRGGRPLKLGVSGDSITQGYNASGYTNAPPHMPPYPDLVAAQLQATFKSDVSLENRAIAGWSIVNGLTDLDKLLAGQPDLILVAYGMNDVGRRDPAWFRGQVQVLIERARKADPRIEIILVAPMLGNGEWIHTPREMFPRYRDALASLTGPGVVLADLTSIWEVLLKTKHDLDLIGNGLNHPNDFGHRLYAQVILSLLVPRQ